jgi:hypothetical protein
MTGGSVSDSIFIDGGGSCVAGASSAVLAITSCSFYNSSGWSYCTLNDCGTSGSAAASGTGVTTSGEWTTNLGDAPGYDAGFCGNRASAFQPDPTASDKESDLPMTVVETYLPNTGGATAKRQSAAET